VTGEARLVFDHPAAQGHFGASIFWLRQLATLSSEEEAILGWQLKREGTRRGIIEITEAMIANDQELKVTLDRIAQFQAQVAYLRNTETNPSNYRAAASGFLLEIDRMQFEVREYLSVHPRDLTVV
jgi:hypothetical protein